MLGAGSLSTHTLKSTLAHAYRRRSWPTMPSTLARPMLLCLPLCVKPQHVCTHCRKTQLFVCQLAVCNSDSSSVAVVVAVVPAPMPAAQ